MITAMDGSSVTIYDIARVAGVSASTVSRTFSRPDRVSFRTAQKVRSAALQLGYRVSTETTPPAGTESAPTGNLGLLVADITNPFFQEVFRGAEEVVRAEGMLLTIADTHESVPRAQTALQHLLPTVDGLLLASTRLANGDILKIARTKPTVCLNHPVRGVPSVLVDNYEGTQKAIVHFESQGARSVTYLAGPHDSWADSLRWRGLLDAARPDEATPDAEPPLTRSPRPDPALAARLSGVSLRRLRIDAPSILGGRRAFAAWQEQPTDAVLCFNDLVGVGFLDEARRQGVAVPGDVMVVGFDNTEITALVPPGLSTVAGPLRTLGRVAAGTLIALIRGMASPNSLPQVLPTRLIVRGSSLRHPTA